MRLKSSAVALKLCAAQENSSVQQANLEVASSQNKSTLCSAKKKSGFILRDCTIAESSVQSLTSVGRSWQVCLHYRVVK